MAVNINWTWGPMIAQDTDTWSGVVTGIHWMCLALDSDSDANGKVSGILDVPAADPSNYVPAAELTNDIVQRWIDLGIDKSAIEAVCLGHLDARLSLSIRNLDIPAALTADAP